MKSPALFLASLFFLSPLRADDALIFEDGKAEPLAEGLEFHHGSWKFGDGAMIGEQVPTEKHTATIKGLMAFDQMKIEWKMKFIVPKQNFLFVTWPAESRGHAMDFTFLPDNGQFAIVRPGSKDQKSAVLAKGQLQDLTKDWHKVVCIHDGPNFTVTIDGVTITAADESFNRPMGPFYLNGGGFDGAKYLVKDLWVTALPGSPQKRAFLPAEPPKAAAVAPVDVTPVEYKPSPDDIVIADFEGEAHSDWKATGNAFDLGARKNRPTGYLGTGLINTYLNGDKSTGTLTSPSFTIERQHLNFLIGGGKHTGETGIRLLIDGKPVRSATGNSLKNSKGQEIMDWHSWDIIEFKGKQATLEILDTRTGGWGHVLVDHLFQSNQPMKSSLPVK
ncbi:MAG: hypothetical protein KDK97_13490 [Verrucomicrobiales bacterium]|nr:hypothetical protein [Verrucomicrobiales bacterium]MCP5558947.1 hypothetical protein [Verrucomicrobiaceae bacterium]